MALPLRQSSQFSGRKWGGLDRSHDCGAAFVELARPVMMHRCGSGDASWGRRRRGEKLSSAAREGGHKIRNCQRAGLKISIEGEGTVFSLKGGTHGREQQPRPNQEAEASTPAQTGSIGRRTCPGVSLDIPARLR